MRARPAQFVIFQALLDRAAAELTAAGDAWQRDNPAGCASQLSAVAGRLYTLRQEILTAAADVRRWGCQAALFDECRALGAGANLLAAAGESGSTRPR
jgi:hypothetical protein